MAVTQGMSALFAGRCRGRAAAGFVAAWLSLFFLAASGSAAEATSTPVKKPAGKTELPQVALINQQTRAAWESNGLPPSPAATEGEWCRRVFLDVLGRIPTVDELKRFQDDPAHERKTRLVNRILGDDYVESYARNWTTIWTNVLIGRSGGTDRRSLVNREGLQQALRRALERDMPYDRLVHELVAARGVSKPGKDDFNGFVNFMAGNLQENAVQATAKTSQIFLGLQIQCTQCHNHPFNDWKQNRFWELNAFFRQTRALKRFEKGRDVDCIELVNQDFAGENNKPEEAALFYEFRNGVSKVAFPVFVDGTKLASDSGFVREVDRRTELARLIVESEYLPRALVNRYWAHFFGYGFTKPIDDMGSHNAASHPELLDGLAEQFKTHSYSVKELIRWIVLSDAYGLSSKMTAKNKKDDPALGEKPMFSHFYLRQMRAEELFESLKVATEAQNAETSYEKREEAKRQWLEQFTVAFGTDDNEETTTFNGTIPQTLMMMNGDMIQKATSVDKGGFLHRVAGDAKMNNKAKINYLYLAALGRTPTNQETALANELMAYRHGDPVAALQDVWWAVLNSNEFILNH
jgi:hypothetical protein